MPRSLLFQRETWRNATLAGIALAVASIAFADDASAKLVQRKYAEVRGWDVVALLDSGALQYCVATTGQDKEKLRIGFNGRQWVVAGRSGKDRVKGTLRIDAMSQTLDFAKLGKVWVYAALRPSAVEAIRQGQEVGLTLGRHEKVFPLTGSAAAMLKVEECAARNSAAPGIAARPAPSAPPPPHQPSSKPNMAAAPKNSACPRGERPLPVTGLCPGKAQEAFLSLDNIGELPMPGCKWAVNETEMPDGDVLMYLASSCKGKTASLAFSAGASTFGLKSSQGDVTITGITVDAKDPEKSIERFAKKAMDDRGAARKCALRADESGMRYTFDVAPDVLAKMAADGPPEAVCGPYGRGDSASYWRAFGGYGWYIGLGQDAYVSIATKTMTLLHHIDDGNSDSMNGWRVKY